MLKNYLTPFVLCFKVNEYTALSMELYLKKMDFVGLAVSRAYCHWRKPIRVKWALENKLFPGE
jgi:hypothetical protein